MDVELLKQIAREYGTPVYVYDLDNVILQFERFKSFFPWPDLKVCYAMKSNYNPHLLRALCKAGAHIDAVSPGDLYMAQACGFDPSRMIYTANNMKDSEMESVMGTGVLMNIGSLSRLEKYARAYPGSRVCLRFNPDVVDGAHEKIKTGGDLTKFGILLEDAVKVEAIIKGHDLKVVGLHEHTGSGLENPDSILKAMENIMSVATRQMFPDLEFLDFGGGFKVPYHPDEADVDYHGIGQRVVEMFSRFCQAYGRALSLVFEPGKFLTAQSGVMLLEVNTIKNNRSRTICGTDSGFPQLIRPMFYDAYHHITNISNPQGTEESYDICGNICETGDLFASQRMISQIRENDILAIEDAGAYCYAMGGNYNLRPMPAEVVIENGSVSLSRRRMTSKQLVDQILSESEGLPA
ncbi:MAG: diaminopimelate decarboxylase [Desulfobacteraceae bacterium]|nr:MAG: diaminopimelate decarboxylase [Desulfobacteraceae bacterium]